jgi:trimeric autotransporter adhesin
MRYAKRSRLALGLLLLGGLVPGAVTAAGSVEEVRVYPGGASIYPGGVFGMGAVAVYEDGSTRDVSAKARFTSETPGVAEVVKKNFLRAKTEGVTQIRATYRNVQSEPVPFEVSNITSLAIIPAENGIRLGTTMFWGATATLANGASGFAFSPFVSWTSDDSNVLPTEDDKKDRGVSVAAALGTANLTATWDRPTGDNLVVTRPITVVNTLTSVVITPAERVIQRGDGGRFRAIGAFEGGVLADISFDVDWSSLDESVVSPSSKGDLKVRGFGKTTLRVVDRQTLLSSEASGGDATLFVVGDVVSLAVEPAALELAVGDEERFDAIADVEESSTDFSWGRRVVWTSSNGGVASVNDDGDVACVAVGTAVISARDPRTGVSSTDPPSGDGVITCVAAP